LVVELSPVAVCEMDKECDTVRNLRITGDALNDFRTLPEHDAHGVCLWRSSKTYWFDLPLWYMISMWF
jgi:hypothetical protein